MLTPLLNKKNFVKRDCIKLWYEKTLFRIQSKKIPQILDFILKELKKRYKIKKIEDKIFYNSYEFKDSYYQARILFIFEIEDKIIKNFWFAIVSAKCLKSDYYTLWFGIVDFNWKETFLIKDLDYHIQFLLEHNLFNGLSLVEIKNKLKKVINDLNEIFNKILKN